MADDYESYYGNEDVDLQDYPAGDQPRGDVQTNPNDIAGWLSSYANNPVAAALGGSFLTGVLNTVSPTIGGVAGGTNVAGDAKAEPSAVSKWWAGLDSNDKRIGMSVATALLGGLSGMSKGRREDRALNLAEEKNRYDATFNQQRIALEQQKMANGSAITGTNFGGMINSPLPAGAVTMRRARNQPPTGVA